MRFGLNDDGGQTVMATQAGRPQKKRDRWGYISHGVFVICLFAWYGTIVVDQTVNCELLVRLS